MEGHEGAYIRATGISGGANVKVENIAQKIEIHIHITGDTASSPELLKSTILKTIKGFFRNGKRQKEISDMPTLLK